MKKGAVNTLDLLSSLFPVSQPDQKPSSDDPFAEALNDLQNKQESKPASDDFFSGFNNQ